MAFILGAVTTILILAAALPTTLASCNGHNVTLLQVKPCKNSIIQPSNIGASLQEEDRKCFLVMAGSVKVAKDFKKAQVTVTVSKDGARLVQETRDVCKSVSDPRDQIDKYIQSFGYSCPMSAGEYTVPPLDLTPAIGLFDLAKGTWTVKAEATHDVGQSCVTTKFRI